MRYIIYINKPIRTAPPTFIIEAFGKHIITERSLYPARILALLRLPSRSIGMPEESIVDLTLPVAEHTAFAIAALLENERIHPESFMTYGNKRSEDLTPTLETYAELIFQGAQVVGENLNGDILADIQRRYIHSEKTFRRWRSAITGGNNISLGNEKTPWQLTIHHPEEEFAPHQIEIQLDNYVVQLGAVYDLLPFMEIIGLFRENFDDFAEYPINIPLPQHRALPLLYFIEHAKRISQTDFPYNWDETCEYLFKGISQGCPRWIFREALRIVDQALGSASCDYYFAPHEYDTQH